MKKSIVFMLALLLLSVMFIITSCNSNDAEVKNPVLDNGDNGLIDPDNAISNEITKDSLPDGLDFNGMIINLLIQGDSWKESEFIAEDEIGEVVNDAIYNRNRSVEDRLNIKLNIISGPGWENWSTMASQIKKSIMAGDYSYDLIAGWSARAPALAVEGLFMDLHELPYVEMSKPWWNQSMLSEMTIGGKLPFLAGDMTLSLIENCSVYYFNKTVHQEFALPDLYQTVLDGKWTLDYAGSMIREISKDLNGDGKMDNKDLYGIALEPLNVADGFMQSSDIKMTKYDDSGMPYLDAEKEKLSNLVDKIYNLYYDNPGTYNYSSGQWPFAMFKNNQILFMPYRLSGAVELRDMQSDYGIIPYPKYDETQEKYLSRIWDALSLMCVPMNCNKTEAVGACMEAMSSESYKTVTPAYFDIALKNKYTRDDVSSQMLDMVREGAYLNFASIYNESIGSPWHCMRTLISGKNKNFASWFEKNEVTITKKIDSIVEKLF